MGMGQWELLFVEIGFIDMTLKKVFGCIAFT